MGQMLYKFETLGTHSDNSDVLKFKFKKSITTLMIRLLLLR